MVMKTAWLRGLPGGQNEHSNWLHHHCGIWNSQGTDRSNLCHNSIIWHHSCISHNIGISTTAVFATHATAIIIRLYGGI